MTDPLVGRFLPEAHHIRRLREAAYRAGVVLPDLSAFTRVQVQLAIRYLEGRSRTPGV